MANTLSAEKRNRQRIKRRARNLNHLTTMRTKVKRARTALTDSKAEPQEMAESIKTAIQQLARAAAKGVIHKRTASRKISRLTLALNKAATNRSAPSTATPKKAVKGKPAKPAASKSAATKAPAKSAAKADASAKPAKAEKAETGAKAAKPAARTKK